MKNIKTLVVSIVFLALFSMPFVVHGKEVDKINVYLFRGETCPHCEEAIEFFKSIEEDYGKYFNLVTYEVWYNAENSQKMADIIDYMGIDVKGIPFILIGEDYYEGFDSDWADEIKDKIVKEYNRSSEERVDIIKNFENDLSKKDLLPVIVGVSVLAVIVVVIFLARRGESEENDNLNDKANSEEKANKDDAEQDDNFLEDELSDSNFEKEDKKVLEKDNTKKTKKKIEDKSESTKKENVKGKTGKKASKKDNK